MADEESSNTDSKENVSYVRKKNIISGVDNDWLLALLGGTAIAVGVANLPQVQDLLRNVFKSMPQLPNTQQPANGQAQLAPPPPLVSPQVSSQEGSRVVHKPANEQQQYAKALETENLEQGGQYNSFNALPERTMQDSKDKDNKRKPYVPGSNVSAGL